jgi:hypothetical protein
MNKWIEEFNKYKQTQQLYSSTQILHYKILTIFLGMVSRFWQDYGVVFAIPFIIFLFQKI